MVIIGASLFLGPAYFWVLVIVGWNGCIILCLGDIYWWSIFIGRGPLLFRRCLDYIYFGLFYAIFLELFVSSAFRYFWSRRYLGGGGLIVGGAALGLLL